MTEKEELKWLAEINRQWHQEFIDACGSLMEQPDDYWKKYITNCSETYESPHTYGHTNINILQFLWGTKMDNIILYWCHAFNPRCIRIHHGCVTCDAQSGRISIRLDDDDRIKRIEQEVNIGGGSGVALEKATREKIAREKIIE